MAKQLILLGAPGSGKGTQAKRLVTGYSFGHLSTGDLLRSEIQSGSALGVKVTEVMNAGKLVDDQTVLELLNANCDLVSNSYIFDGFPRNREQAKLLDDHVLKGTDSVAIFFDLDLELLTQRLVNRRTCGGCGEIYNLLYKPPVNEGVCDKCGSSELKQRKDDNEDTVRTRLSVFSDTIGPILSYYEESGRLCRLDASRAPDVVFSELIEKIK